LWNMFNPKDISIISNLGSKLIKHYINYASKVVEYTSNQYYF